MQVDIIWTFHGHLGEGTIHWLLWSLNNTVLSQGGYYGDVYEGASSSGVACRTSCR